MDTPLKEDRRISRSKTALKKAFLNLLAEMPEEKISIGAIIEKAGYSKPTFYRHYEDKPDFIKKMMEEEIADLDATIKKYQEEHPQALKNAQEAENLREAIFGHIYKERAIYTAFFTYPCFAGFHRKLLDSQIARTDLPVSFFDYPKQEYEDYFNYVSSYVFVATIRFWAEQNFMFSPAQIASIYTTAFYSTNTNLFDKFE